LFGDSLIQNAEKYSTMFAELDLAGDEFNVAIRNLPQSEDGRKTLAHKLEHVAQYEEGRIMAGASIKELEV